MNHNAWTEDRVLGELAELYNKIHNEGAFVTEPATHVLDAMVAALPPPDRDSLMTYARVHVTHGDIRAPMDERTARTMASTIANVLNEWAAERAA